jgi:Zn-dependent protease
VFLIEPDPTPFDLRWRMFGVSIRVHPMFWLITLVLGWDIYAAGHQLGLLLLWVACVFVSILIHELGHVFMGRIFGSNGYVVLYSLGGMAIGSSDVRGRWQRTLVYLAGPLAQFILLGVVWLLGPRLVMDNLSLEVREYLAAAVLFLTWINLYWAILNLMPIWPLDGGRITREACEGLMGPRGVSFSLGISMVVAGILALHMLMASRGTPLIPYIPGGGMISALFFAMFCISSFQAMQIENERSRRREEDWPWQ